MSELEDFLEHLERYRAVTLQHFEILSEEDMVWRPRSDAFTCAQQLLHIVQSEDFFINGLFGNDWNLDRISFPQPMPQRPRFINNFSTSGAGRCQPCRVSNQRG